jgi:hypothetical protein
MNKIKGFENCDLEFTDNINNLEDGGYLIEVSSNKELGFNYPYLLFIPKNVNSDSTIIVEGSNTNKSETKIIMDVKSAKDIILKSVEDVKKYFGNNHPIKRINEKTTNYPFLYPLFPRLVYKNQDIYNHMLSTNSMFIEDNDLKELGIYRTDLQLIEMIKDARDRLENYGLNVEDKVIMYGFSAAAKFANRFTLLHPEIVKCTFAAALGGTITLPLREIDGENLIWPVGIGNVKEITDEKLELYKQVPQFYFQGMLDKNDCYQMNGYGTCRYKGILQDKEAVQMYKLLGKNMNEDRWEKTINVISNLNFNITLASCEEGHKPHMLNDIIEETFNSLIKNKSL